MSKPTLFIIRKEMDILRPYVIQVTREEDLLQVDYIYRTPVKGKLEDFRILGYRLTREFLEKRPDWKDCTQFGMHLKSYDFDYMQGCITLIRNAINLGADFESIKAMVSAHMPRFNTINRNGYLINISAASYVGRVSSVEAHALIPAYRLVNWVQKLRSTKFTECCVNLAADPACTVEILSGDRSQDICNSSEIYKKLIHEDEAIKQQVWRPKLRLTPRPLKCYVNAEGRPDRTHSQLMGTPSLNTKEFPGATFSGSTVVIDVQLIREWYNDDVHAEAEVYLEAIEGYLPKTRVKLDKNGHGTFKLMSFGLEPGDTMRVKAGFCFQPGIAETTIEILQDH